MFNTCICFMKYIIQSCLYKIKYLTIGLTINLYNLHKIIYTYKYGKY